MCELANWAIRNPDETNQRTSLPPSACCRRAPGPVSASSTLTSTFGATDTPRYEGALMSKSRMSSRQHCEDEEESGEHVARVHGVPSAVAGLDGSLVAVLDCAAYAQRMKRGNATIPAVDRSAE